MEAKELRSFNVEELKGRVKQWRDELFRAKFKSQTTEAKDTSVFKKLRRDIARGETILNEKVRALAAGTLTEVKAPAVEDKPVTKKAAPAKKEAPAAQKSEDGKPEKKAKSKKAKE